MFSIKTPSKTAARAPAPAPAPSKRQRHTAEQSRSAAYHAEQSRQGRDVSDDLPDCANPERRAKGRKLEYFLRTYFPQTFYLDWSQDHLTALTKLEAAETNGGQFAYAMPRGSGKTSMAEGTTIHAVLYGLRRFIFLIGSDKDHALGMLDSIKIELETNELLLADFRHAIQPIRALEGIANRCKGQHWKGTRTHIQWKRDMIVMPTVAGSPASGAIIAVAGLTGGIRGKKFKRPDGQSVRPDFALPDDPQTDESARSPSQVDTRERIISGAVMGLAGPGTKIAAVCPCTVIAPDDLAERLLDPKRHPEWQGQRSKLVYAFPTNTALWDQYAQIRAQSQQEGNEGKEATEFYRQHRAEMDAGAHVAWPARFDPGELSAIQHAMNKKIDLKDPAFFAEYQNAPIIEQEGEQTLTADEICRKLNGIERRTVPIGCDVLTCHIDVQGNALFYLVAAWSEGFTGYVIDAGSFPDQKRPYYTISDMRITLQTEFPAGGLESQIYAGLDALTTQLLTRAWMRADKTELKINKLLIDANWGKSTDVVYQFCRQTAHAALVMPAHGKYVGARSTPWEHYKQGAGEKLGQNWLIKSNARGIRHAVYDTNHWKTFVHSHLRTPMGDKGCLSLYGRDPAAHRLLADHFTAETGVQTEGRGRKVIEWTALPNRDNHFFDDMVGAAAAASMCGIKLDIVQPVKAKPRKVKRVTYAQGW